MSVKNEGVPSRSMALDVEAPGAPAEERPAIRGGEDGLACVASSGLGKRGGRRSMVVRGVLASAALLAVLVSVRAQEPPKQDAERDQLKRLVGTWSAETESGKGTMTYKMDLGGTWLVGDFDGEFGEMKFLGKGLDSYDATTKTCRSVWVDSFSASPRIMEGTWDKDNKVMTMTGEGPFQEGKTAKYKSITEIKDADTVGFSLFVVEKDGKEQPMVKITYKRKK